MRVAAKSTEGRFAADQGHQRLVVDRLPRATLCFPDPIGLDYGEVKWGIPDK